MTTLNLKPAEIRLLIEADKINKYLLNPDHVDGGPKCALLIAFGFSRDKPDILAEAIVEHARRFVGDGTFIANGFVPKVVCEGLMQTPIDRPAWTTSVWEVELTEPLTLRFITAYINEPP